MATQTSNIPPIAIIASGIARDHRATETHLRVMIALSARANAKKGCIAYPSMQTLSNDTAIHQNHLRAPLKDLVKWSYLELVGFTKHGTKKYKILRPGFNDTPMMSIKNGDTLPPTESVAKKGQPPNGFRWPNMEIVFNRETPTTANPQEEQKSEEIPQPNGGGFRCVIKNGETGHQMEEPPAPIEVILDVTPPANLEAIPLETTPTIQPAPLPTDTPPPPKQCTIKFSPIIPETLKRPIIKILNGTSNPEALLFELQDAMVKREINNPIGYLASLKRQGTAFIPTAYLQQTARLEANRAAETIRQAQEAKTKQEAIQAEERAEKLNIAIESLGADRLEMLRVLWAKNLPTSGLLRSFYLKDGFKSKTIQVAFRNHLAKSDIVERALVQLNGM